MKKDDIIDVYQVMLYYIQGMNEGDEELLGKVLRRDIVRSHIEAENIVSMYYSDIITNVCGNTVEKKQRRHNADIKILDIIDYAANIFLKCEYIESIQMIKRDDLWKIIRIVEYSNQNHDMNRVCSKIESEHFIIEYSDIDKGCIGKIMGMLEERYGVVTAKLLNTLNQKTRMKICSDKEELHLALELKDASDWIRGGINNGKIIMASPLNPTPGSDFSSIMNTAVHEIVHVILADINKNIPKWLDEGIASYEGRDNNEAWVRNTVKNGIANGDIPTIDDLDTKDDFESFFKRNGYQYSYMIIEFIEKRFGYSHINQLVRKPSDFTGIFHMTKEQFQNEWFEFLKEHYSR